MGAGEDWRKTFRPAIPSPARMYNYFLGGKDHYERLAVGVRDWPGAA
jgi:S-adenosyl methyltransferase